MFLINPDTRLCDLINADLSIITLLNRFGITLGVGDTTVNTICEKLNIDTPFFTIILNTVINEDYFPEKIMSTFRAQQLVEYLSKTNAYYSHMQLPNIERHFNLLIQNSKQFDNNLTVIKQFFDEVKIELMRRIQDDTDNWFPEILAKEKEYGKLTHNHVPEFFDDQDTLDNKFADLINMLIKHLNGQYDVNLCYAVLYAIVSLKKDITKNDRIRNRILQPLYTLYKS